MHTNSTFWYASLCDAMTPEPPITFFFFCRKNIAYLLVFSHRNISHLFMVLDSPLTFKEQINNSSAKAFGQVKGVHNRK